MKNKILICFAFAALGLALQGCGPEENQVLGMVWEDQAGKPVPGVAVMAIIWIEDADKATKKQIFEDRAR